MTTVVGQVYFKSTVSPGDEDDLALLFVEGKILDIQGAVGLGHSGKHPQHVAV